LLPDNFAVIALARQDYSNYDFRGSIAEDLHVPLQAPGMETLWQALESRIFYLRGDLNQPEAYAYLRERMAACDRDLGTAGNWLFYLAIAPQLLAPAVQHLGATGLVDEADGHWRRVVVEKPFGRDLASARQLNRELRAVLQETQIYRIDHYLGKETVQNLLVFRFANGIFEPLRNRRYVDHVQITVSEMLGVSQRGGYYDCAGALRDMVPNHLFQLVTFIGMEPPPSLDATALREEQVKLLRCIRPFTDNEAISHVVRGQYGPGRINRQEVLGYRQEPHVAPDSHTETFVALKINIENWRWAGVPFYLRTGKRLDQRHTEIVIQFRQAPHLLFKNTAVSECVANHLVLSIQPAEGVSLRFGAKIPGPIVKLGTVTMDFDYEKVFGNWPSTGYERLLHDCMIGDQTLFKREDTVEEGWSIIAPIQKAWEQSSDDLAIYPAGSSGPQAAAELLHRDGRRWREEVACR
jgi:glucose-6-phosphate 1-dehydrogenase